MTKISSLCAAALATVVACTARPSETSAPPAAPPPQAHDAAAAELIAQIERAVQAWRDSCPDANEQDLCIELAAAEDSPQRCAAPMLGRVIVHSRDPELAARAQAELAAAMDRAGCHDPGACKREILDVQPHDPALKRDFLRALAAARLARADAELEAYFAVTLPRDIDFVVEEWKRDSTEPDHAEQHEAQLAKKQDSEQRFEAYYDAKTTMAESLTRDLARIKPYGDQELVLRAALRTSWTALHFYDELQAAEVPSSLQDQPQRDAYCRALDDHATVARDMAKGAVLYCTMRAAQHGISNHTVDTCRELLAQLEQP